jgi:membrane-bound lytic murein transglycosylase B
MNSAGIDFSPFKGRLFAVALIGLASAALSFPCRAAEGRRAPAFSESPAVREFIVEMQARHGFDAAHLTRQFASIRGNPAVLRAIRPAAAPETQRSWRRYRARFVNESRLAQGLRFRQEHRIALLRAEAIYGVPREIVAAIIGVETEYGRNTGKFRVLEALATLAFDYPPRAPFFRRELEQFLLLARESGVPPLDYKGSYAGAIGIPQFMPSSQRSYAVDFDGDGRIDLSRSAADAIGSVARFLSLHGWRPGEPVALPASVNEDVRALLAMGIKPSMPLREMQGRGVLAAGAEDLADAPAALIDLPSPGQPTEYWVGFTNFHALTRYNRSSFYAMSVFLLAESLREAREEAPAAEQIPKSEPAPPGA